jgi:hypothetical protein
MRFKLSLAALLVGLTLWVGCAAPSPSTVSQQETQGNTAKPAATATPAPSPRPYSKDLDELRASFNRDKGKVRLVTLLSPT